MAAAQTLIKPHQQQSKLENNSNNNDKVSSQDNRHSFEGEMDLKKSDKVHESSQIAEFYRGKNVLLTGASGFLGKVILWRLLNTCPDIGKIYVLIRHKNNLSAEKRLIQMLKGKPFSFKYQYTELIQRVVAIESDMTEPGLGLSQSNRTLLEDQVNIVIHSAASVKFDAALKDNLRDNVYGTRSILNLCDSMQNIKALVHVSTAYSNCQAKDIGEDLQPLEMDIDDVTKIVESLPSEACELITDKLLEGRPNTYTYTKAMAEHYVARHEGKYPISIVRPSIVISAAQEPCEGWVDNVNGIAGLGCLGAIGILRQIDWDYYATSDVVPVDYVSDCIICAAHQVHVKSPEKILFYNMTSGSLKPISWGAFFTMLRDKAQAKPTNKIVRPIITLPRHRRANPIKFFLTKWFSELLFAYTIDLLLRMFGFKKIMVKITQKMHHGYEVLRPFTSSEWNFDTRNLVDLWDSLSPRDKEIFNFDLRQIDWDEQADVTWEGAREMLLKEENSEESYKAARSRQMMVTFVHYTFPVISACMFLFIGYLMFR